jgi:geranylgeranyl diphosphate synthase, type II
MEQQASAVEAALDRATSPDAHPVAPDHLLEAMRYSLLGGGKRLRPIMLIAAAEMFGAARSAVMPAACALECIHTYSLVHDDLPCMDDDDFRRGKPTNHRLFGEANAILAGDALLTLAFELLGGQAEQPGIESGRVARVIREVAAAAGASGMVGGQVEDLAFAARPVDPAALERIHRMKTGALFRASLRAGALLAGGGEADLALLDRYAGHFGLAFQIQDDVLDVAGDRARLGKSTGSDEKNRKSTYVSLYGLQEARERALHEAAAAGAALAPFGERAAVLQALAAYVADRDR